MKHFLPCQLLFVLLILCSCGDDAIEQTWLAVGQSNMDAVGLNLSDAGPADYFARAMTTAGHPTTILLAARGSTTITCWRHGGDCFLKEVSQFLGRNIDGILYWQGENDANWGTEDAYGDNFRALIEEYRANFGDVPFIFVQLQKFIPSINGWDVKMRTEDGSLLTTEPYEWSICRSEQESVLNLDKVYMVETQDITNGEIHPVYAYEQIGERAAEIAIQLSD